MTYSPKYLKIVELLQRRFSNGEFAVGTVLPGEIALSQELGVSRRTLRNALQVLEDDGFIIRKKGVGSVLAPVDMHRRRRRSDVAIVYSAAPDAAHNYDFLLQHTLLADGIIRGMASKGHWLRIVPLAEQNYPDCRDELFRKGIDGFIFPDLTGGVQNMVSEVVRRKVPHVVYESALLLEGANIITADDYQAGYDMVSMLLDEGVEKLAVIGGLFKSEIRNSANRRRFNGAQKALQDRNIAIDKRFFAAVEDNVNVMPSGEERQKISAIVRSMLAEKDMPHTVILSSLIVADVFIEELKKAAPDAAESFRLLTFHGSCPWDSVKNSREVAAMEYFACNTDELIKRGTEMLDRWLNDPAYRPERVFMPCSYHQGSKEPMF